MTRRFYVDIAHGQMQLRMVATLGFLWIVLLQQSPSTSIMFVVLIRLLSPHFSVISPNNLGFGRLLEAY